MHYNLNVSLLDRNINMLPLRSTFAVIFALAMLSLAPRTTAQQKMPAAPRQAPALSDAAKPAPAPAASDSSATSADGGGRPLKSTTVALRELSPWSMFLSAD